MATTIHAEKQRLYETSSLRDDLYDDEAQRLLQWGETQLERLATAYPDQLALQARELRYLIKGINRFVGQREFNGMAGQRDYMAQLTPHLAPLGWQHVTADQLFAALPDDAADMSANLTAILAVLNQAALTQPQATQATAQASVQPAQFLSIKDWNVFNQANILRPRPSSNPGERLLEQAQQQRLVYTEYDHNLRASLSRSAQALRERHQTASISGARLEKTNDCSITHQIANTELRDTHHDYQENDSEQ